MSSELASQNPEYRQWLSDLKTRYRQVQLKAAVAVNTALLEFYWSLGTDILTRQSTVAWGQGFLTQLSADLMADSLVSLGSLNATWSRSAAGWPFGTKRPTLRSSLLRN